MSKRPRKPADDAGGPAWDAYDGKVIEAFLREAEDRLAAAPESFPGKAEHGRLALNWLRGRLDRVARGALT